MIAEIRRHLEKIVVLVSSCVSNLGSDNVLVHFRGVDAHWLLNVLNVAPPDDSRCPLMIDRSITEKCGSDTSNLRSTSAPGPHVLAMVVYFRFGVGLTGTGLRIWPW
jgi:hypothetical protein